MIRTLVADDSAIVRAMLCQVLSDSKNFEITGTAENGKIALEMARSLKPELIIMDINMPIMNGIEATSRIKEIYDPAIVAFTTEDTAEVGYRCLEAGAVEVDQKPIEPGMEAVEAEFRHPGRRRRVPPVQPGLHPFGRALDAARRFAPHPPIHRIRLVRAESPTRGDGIDLRGHALGRAHQRKSNQHRLHVRHGISSLQR